jgi:hypothetical protein
MPKANPYLAASGNYRARVRVRGAPAIAKMKRNNIIWYPSKDPNPSTRTRARTYCGWAVPWQLPAYAVTLAPDSRPMTNPPPETQSCARKEDMGRSKQEKKQMKIVGAQTTNWKEAEV